MAENTANLHKLHVEGRTRAEIFGVSDVSSFDETAVVLRTVSGELTVEGEGLHVSTLDMTRGAVVIDGTVNAFYYETESPARRGLFGRRRA